MSSSSAVPNWKRHLHQQLLIRKSQEVDPFSALSESFSNLRVAHERKANEVTSLRKENDSMAAERASLRSEVLTLSEAAKGVVAFSKREKELEEQLQALTPQLASALENANRLFDAQAKLRQNEAELKDLRRSKDDLEEKCAAYKTEMNVRDSSNALLKQENNALQAENAMQRESYAHEKAENARLMPIVLKSKETEMELQQRIFELENALKDALQQQQQLRGSFSPGGKSPVDPSSIVLGIPSERNFKDPNAFTSSVLVPTRVGFCADLAHDTDIHTCCITENSRQIWTGGLDKCVKGWDVSNGAASWRMGSSASVVCLDSRSNYLVGGCTDNTCRVWHLPTQRLQGQLTGHTEVVTASYLGLDAQTVFTASRDCTIKSWDLQRGGLMHTSLCPSSCYDLAVATDRICTAHFDNALRFWDVRSGKASGDIMNLHDRAVTCVRLTPDNRHTVSLGRDNTIRMCDMRMLSEVAKFTESNFGISSNQAKLCLGPEGNYVAAGSSSGTVFVWSLMAPDEKAKQLKGGHTGATVAVAWSPDGKGLASAGLDKKLIYWR